MNAPDDKTLSSLARLGEDLYEAEAKVLRLEAELARAKKVRDVIKREEIPEVMAETGITSFSTATSSFLLKEVLSVRPKAADRPRVIQALEEMGEAGLIKNQVSVSFAKGQDSQARALVDQLAERGILAEQARKVEPSTLRAFVRRRLAAGESVDMDLFGVQQFKEAEFKDGAPEAPVFEDEESEES